jgi:AAA15 family ATPase/GTPase/5S rRNA maturation endonuclease (ribonuclease M5)
MLTKIGIENFKGIRKCEIFNLGKVNVFVGRNNSGKSSILDALCLIRSAFNPMLFNEPIPHLLLKRKAIERSIYVSRNFWHNYYTKQRIKFYLEFKSGEKLAVEMLYLNDNQFQFLFEDPSNTMGKSIEGKYFARRGLDLGVGLFDDVGNFREFATKFPHLNNFLSEIVLIDDYLARKLERLETSVFSRILEPRLDKKVVEKLNEIYNVEAEGLTYIPISPTTQGFRLAVPTRDSSLHIDEMGDGAKYATVILSLCFLLENTAFLIEEIESHQHSGAITKLIPRLVEIANLRNVQLFLTTHSIEVMEAFSKLPKEYDINFFHLENKKGDIEVRHLGTNIDVKLLLDLGVDLRYLEAYKKFIVVEGDEDIQFFKSLLQRYGKDIERLGYLIRAGGKELSKDISVALLSTKKDVIIAVDCDKQDKEALIQSLINALENKKYKIKNRKDNTLELEGDLKITLLPLGLYNDERLKQIGIRQFEMEDYCLKLIDADENLRKWAGEALEDLIKKSEHAGIEKMNLHKSSTLLKLLALKKDMAYKDLIDYIIMNASNNTMENVITRELKEFLSE